MAKQANAGELRTLVCFRRVIKESDEEGCPRMREEPVFLDGQGRERGALVTAILARLQPQNPGDACQARWDKVWGDALCQRYRRPEHEDHWIWSYDFYNAPTVDLWHIARLIGAKPKYK